MILIADSCNPSNTHGTNVNNNTSSCTNRYTGDICDSAGTILYKGVCIYLKNSNSDE